MEGEADRLIQQLRLMPHPEGGYYRETYRAGLKLPAASLPGAYANSRSASTAIYYLLRAGDVSRLHRVRSDEIWHFYSGDPLEIVTLSPQGARTDHLLGSDIGVGMCPQFVVPAGHWQGARVREGGQWTLVGCTVAPGFEFADFEMANATELLRRFPRHADSLQQFL